MKADVPTDPRDDPSPNKPGLITPLGNTSDELLPQKGLASQKQALPSQKEAESSAPVEQSLTPAIDHRTRSAPWAVLELKLSTRM